MRSCADVYAHVEIRTMEWLGLSIFAWITIGVMIGKFGLSVTTNLPGDVVSLMSMGVLIVTGCVTTRRGLESFSDDSVWLVIMLLVLVNGLVKAGVVDWTVKNVMGNPKSYRRALNKLMWPVGALSMFLNNETLVSVFYRVVMLWCKNLNLAPSRMLIPLSYAACLGGMCTLIGSPANLMVSSVYLEETGIQMNLFTPFLPGVCVAIVGLIAMNLLVRMLPVRTPGTETINNNTKYSVELLVPTEAECVGKTVEEAGLNKVNGSRLLEIVRFDGEVIFPVAKDEFILGGDKLVYTGRIRSVLAMRNQKGLVSATHHVFRASELKRNREFQMVTLLTASPLVGHRISETDFEKRYNVVLVAVARNGEQLQTIPHDIVLRSRDILLFEGQLLNPEEFQYEMMFLDNLPVPVSGNKTAIATLSVVGIMLANALNLIDMLHGCILACFLLVGIRCLSVKQFQSSLNWQLLCSYCGSICLATAINDTGLAAKMATLVQGLAGTNPIVALLIICTITTFITEFISNVGAAAVFAPVGFYIASNMGVNPLTFMVAIMFCASSSFATPGSCDTHELVSAPAGYTMGDFARIGVPMNFITLVTAVVATVIFIPL